MIVSPSMTFVAAGVASAICLLWLHSARKGKRSDRKKETREVPVDDTRCACCFKPFFVDRGIRCSDCNAKACRKGCSRWETEENAWHCIFCHQQRCWQKRKEKWFETFGGDLDEDEVHKYFSTAKSRVYVAGVENAAASSGSGLATQGQEETHTMETVRDFVEKIVEGLIGNVDDTPINRLYDHPAYDKLLATYIVPLTGALTRLAVALQLSLTNKPTTDPPTMAHTALRDIVERAVDEARKLPGLSTTPETNTVQEGRTISEHSYEDLLATAILNKVIEKFQRGRVDSNSNVLHENSTSKEKRVPSESELGLDEGVEEGCSSLEPLSQDECSDCGASSSRHIRSKTEPLSLTIEERIEEVTTTYTSDDEHRENDVLSIRNAHRVPFPEFGMDIIDPSQESSEDSQDELDSATPHMDMVSPIESWEENWLFQRKKVQTQADSVAMLVPNPSADYKALIGDKDAEDTSDLSECSSAQSDEEIEKELMEAISNVVPRSPKKMDLDSETQFDTPIPNGSVLPENLILIQDEDIDVFKTSKESSAKGLEKPLPSREMKCYDYTSTIKDPLLSNEKNETKEAETTSSKTCSLKNSDKATAKEGTDTRKVERDSKECYQQSSNLTSNTTAGKNQVGTWIPNAECNHIVTIESTGQSRVNDAKTDRAIEEIPVNSNNANENLTLEEQLKVCDVPRTPTSTPIKSFSSNCFERANNAANLITDDEHVLNSLECAKKKLMVDDREEEMRTVEEEAKENVSSKVDLHAEDAQQDSEYTEHYDIATQRHLDSLTKTDTISGEIDVAKNEAKPEDLAADNGLGAQDEEEINSVYPKSEEKTQLTAPPRPGTIAEREHKKWENAPPIENNPYSPESIQKRLLERQYARRLSDIPGMHAELPKTNSTDLDADFTPNEPDITRFGRDYYINNSKIASGDRCRRSGSSRPSSSLSQRSNSTTPGDQEPQDEPLVYRETERPLVTGCPKNNVDLEKNEELTSNQNIWEDKRVEEILENERKNNKNEINAKLNNQENYDNSGLLEAKKTYSEENRKKIRRIDLKAYGFENEFFVNNNRGMKTGPERVVNKLDLKSFGYDGGLRRCQSNNQLDSTVNESDFKPRSIRATNKSNLTRHSDYAKLNDCHSLIENAPADDNNLTQSTDGLDKLHEESYSFFGGLKSAKSVPNIAKCDYYSNSSNDREDEEIESCTSYSSARELEELNVIMNGQVVKAVKNYQDPDKCNVKNGDAITDQMSSSMDQLSLQNEKEEILETKVKIDRKLPMPSVRKLAQAFNKSPEYNTTPTVLKPPKTNGVSTGRSSTPEIHIVETPKQMHSLTARSLSKKFREGLRQIPNKVTSPPASHVTMEQSRIQDNQTEVVHSKGDRFLNDTDVISPGKLQSNIKFWEQMQRKY